MRHGRRGRYIPRSIRHIGDSLLSYAIGDAAPNALVADVDLLDHVAEVCIRSLDDVLIVSAGSERPGTRPAETFAVGGLPVPARS